MRPTTTSPDGVVCGRASRRWPTLPAHSSWRANPRSRICYRSWPAGSGRSGRRKPSRCSSRPWNEPIGLRFSLPLLQGLNESLKGRRQVDRPDAWLAASAKLAKSDNPEVRSLSTSLGVTFGDAAALEAMRKTLADPAPRWLSGRMRWPALLKIKDAGSVPTLQFLIADPAFRRPASAPWRRSTTRRRRRLC